MSRDGSIIIEPARLPLKLQYWRGFQAKKPWKAAPIGVLPAFMLG
jgi:hypothetical protein